MTLGIGSGGGKNTAIGIGMWLGIIMAYNVWFIIWPNQKSFRYCRCLSGRKILQREKLC